MRTIGSGLDFLSKKQTKNASGEGAVDDRRWYKTGLSKCWEDIFCGKQTPLLKEKVRRQMLTAITHCYKRFVVSPARLFQLISLCWIIKWRPVLWLVSAHLLLTVMDVLFLLFKPSLISLHVTATWKTRLREPFHHNDHAVTYVCFVCFFFSI